MFNARRPWLHEVRRIVRIFFLVIYKPFINSNIFEYLTVKTPIFMI